jgi:nucleotide-binding universal stress UspA family protein
MKSILVATDFSQPSVSAANYAAALAAGAGAELNLLHAYLLPTPVSEVPYLMVSVEELQKDNEKLTNDLANKLRESYGVKVKTLVTIGLPADEVVYQSGELNADLIVTGMRGSTNALDKLIGSTTAAILRKSGIPVLVIPEHSVYKPWNTVVYATDFSHPMNEKDLLFLTNLAGAQSKMHINIVHVEAPGHTMVDLQISGRRSLEAILQNVSHDFKHLEHSNVEQALRQYLHDNPSDALVMVAHKHSWWDRLVGVSHTREMVYKSEIPLLVLHDK